MRYKEKNTIIQIVLAIALLLFSFYRIRIGIHSDEIHSLAVGDMIARGSSMFKDCWFYLQLSAVITAPLAWIYNSIAGSNDGIILYYRILAVLVQAGIVFFFYSTFRNISNRFYVFVASICLFSFVPDFLNFGYKPELIWFTILEICFAYKYCINGKKKHLIFMGIAMSLNVLCFPTAVFQAMGWLIFLFVRNRKKHVSIKEVWIFPITCLGCAVLFFCFVLSQISVSEFFKYFPEILEDDQLAGNFISKLYRPFIKMLELGGLSIIPVLVCKRFTVINNIISKLKVPVVSILFISSFILQCYIERAGITWHCITYPYSLSMFLFPLMFMSATEEFKVRNRDMFWCFISMTWISYWAISVASNQNNITCIYAGIFSACGMLIMLGEQGENETIEYFYKEKKFISISLCMMALLMYIIPVWDQEAIYFETYGMRTIFSERVFMNEGPAKGIWVGQEMYDRVSDLCNTVDEYTTEKDKVYIVESAFYASFGYMHQKGEYATYSPRGSYLDRIADYYDVNPDKIPTVIIISKNYINDRYDESFPKGKSLEKIIDNNEYVRNEDDKFIVYKKI